MASQSVGKYLDRKAGRAGTSWSYPDGEEELTEVSEYHSLYSNVTDNVRMRLSKSNTRLRDISIDTITGNAKRIES
jgi:hypothetical protein